MGFKRKPPIADEVLFLYPAWCGVAQSYFFKGETFDEMEKKFPLEQYQSFVELFL